jgi:hypothetical protein
MSLASEDKQQLREIRRLLEEIRDLLKRIPDARHPLDRN